MRLNCPNCGAMMSLDALLANDEAREALAKLMAIGGDITRLAVRYCGLFRPAKSQLSFARLAKLLGELEADIRLARIERGGLVHEAPLDAWIYAFNAILAQRESLKLPLKSHGYLYEILSRWQAPSTFASPAAKITTKTSKASQALAALEELK